MNLCRDKFRDHQRLFRGPLSEYSVETAQGMGAVPRAGNNSGGGQLGNAIHCKPQGPHDWSYADVPASVWEVLMHCIGDESAGKHERCCDVATLEQGRED